MGLLDMLNQALSQNHADDPEHHARTFDQVTQTAPADVLGHGIGSAFASNQTPPIGDMVSSLFGRSNASQQAGVLNSVISAIGPAAAAALAGGVLSRVLRSGQTQVSEAEVAQLSPQQVRDVVNEAHQQQPSVADQLGQFYAQHRGLINTLGGLAATVALTRMKDRLTDR